MSQTRLENSTFKGAEPTWANACVGENGNPQIIEYANGFACAANLLIDQIIADGGRHLLVDEYIYPICFNMRHAVELHLKGTIEKLTSLAECRRRKLPEFPLVSTHDLGNVWQYIKTNAASLDKRYAPQLAELDEYVTDIAEVDSTGQVFRYPFDTENRKHLVDVAIVNVIVLKQRFNKLQEMLSELNHLSILLVNEYACGSFTTKLSRAELFELASKLPKRGQWRSEEFDTAKSTLRTEYGLSNNDFCRALVVIQGHYEMSQLIDAVPPLQAVTAPILHIFFDGWIKLHDIEDLRTPSPTCIDELGSEWTADLLDHSRSKAEIEQWWGESKGIFTSNHIAELKALYYFSSDMPYSEYFKASRERFNKVAATYNQDEIKDAILHLLNKTGAMEGILKSLKFLGQVNLVESVVERYDLHSAA